MTESSAWKAQPGKLSPTEPQQPSPRLRCVGHNWRCHLAASGRKILFSPRLNGAAPPHVLCEVDARKDCRCPFIFGIPSRVKVISNRKIPLRNLYLQFWLLPKLQTGISHWSPTQLILFQPRKRHTSCLCKCTILLKPWLCMKTSSLLPECCVLILTSNCLISVCKSMIGVFMYPHSCKGWKQWLPISHEVW